MLRKLIGIALACALPASLALAQTPSGSRLDDVIKSGKLRVCTPGDYKPFSYQRPDGGYEGLDIDLVAVGGQVARRRGGYGQDRVADLMKDFLEKCDVAVGGISVSTDRQKTAFFTSRVHGQRQGADHQVRERRRNSRRSPTSTSRPSR